MGSRLRFQGGLALPLIVMLGSGLHSTFTEAVTLQPSRFAERLEGHFVDATGDEDTPETLLLNQTIEDVGSASGFAATTGGVRPRAEVQMNIAMASAMFASASQVASAAIRYYWAIEQVGGIPYGDRVPVELDTRALTAYTLDTALNYGLTMRATAFFDVADEGTTTFTLAPCLPKCNPGTDSDSFHEILHVNATPNLANRIQLDAVITASLFRDTSLDAVAWVDPIITISPDFDRRDDFRIVYSSYVDPVPLPLPALLFASAIPWLIRRRRVS